MLIEGCLVVVPLNMFIEKRRLLRTLLEQRLIKYTINTQIYPTTFHW